MKALENARLAPLKITDDKPEPPNTNPDGDGNTNNGSNSSGTGTGTNSGNNNSGKGNKLTNIDNKSNTQGSRNNTRLPQTDETKLVMASLIGLEILLICVVVYFARKKKRTV